LVRAIRPGDIMVERVWRGKDVPVADEAPTIALP
jgi:hypothetical protein